MEICSLCLGETCGDVDNPLHEWSVSFPPVPKPDIVEPPLPQVTIITLLLKTYRNLFRFFQEGAPTFKVLHLSDTHYDPEYAVGSPSVCGEPLCCREYSTPIGGSGQKFAGK